jgi:hypothetical protein
MSQLRIRGKVLHEAGPWGEHLPVSGARIEILSGHEQTRGSDLIMLATTNANGDFEGLTTEWRGTVLRTVPDPNRPWRNIQVEEPDMDEPLILRARIRQNTTAGLRTITVPVDYTDDMTPIAPLVVNWGPAEHSVIGFVNGDSCTSPAEFMERTIIQLNARRGEVKLEAFGQAAEPFLELTAPTARQARLAAALHMSRDEVLRIRTLLTCNDGMESCEVVDSFWISIVVASIIFAPATPQAAAAFGLSLQRLLYGGYQIASVGNASVAMDGMGVKIRLHHPEWQAAEAAHAVE